MACIDEKTIWSAQLTLTHIAPLTSRVGGCVGWWVWAMAAANGGGDGGVDGGANGPVPMARGSRRPREAVVVVAALGERESGALSNSLC